MPFFIEKIGFVYLLIANSWIAWPIEIYAFVASNRIECNRNRYLIRISLFDKVSLIEHSFFRCSHQFKDRITISNLLHPPSFLKFIGQSQVFSNLNVYEIFVNHSNIIKFNVNKSIQSIKEKKTNFQSGNVICCI